MADDASHGASSSTVQPADDPDATIEINIKTLDSQVHKLRVNRNVPISILKEKIVDATGVPLDQQRLIFRGRVLKDDHLLSEYRLEDGYRFHLLDRRAAEGQQSSGTAEANTHAHVNVAANGVLLDDIYWIAWDFFRDPLGIARSGVLPKTAFSILSATAPEGTNNIPGRTQPVNPAQPWFSVLNHQIHVAQLPPTGAIPRSLVIPDSLTTLSEYMDHMDQVLYQVLQNNGTRPSRDSEGRQRPIADDASLNPRFPSPEVLASVIERVQQLLGGSASSALSATWAETVKSGRLVKECLSQSQANWANIPWDLLGTILARSSFRDGILAYKTVCKEWAMMPNDYLRRIFPADVIPLLLHCCSGEKTLRFYDPISSIIFEVDYPKNSKIGTLCDFRFQNLLTVIPDGVLLINILTGAGFCWEIVAMPSDCFVLSTSGQSIKAVIAMKGSGYSTTVAVLKKSSRTERTFATDVEFTVSSVTNPVLRNTKLFCLSTKGALGVLDLASNTIIIYEDGQEEDDLEDSYSEDSDEENYFEDSDDEDANSSDDDLDDEESDSEDSDDDDDSDVLEDNRNRFAGSAEFLCESSAKEIHCIQLDNPWQSARVKKLEEPGMYWADVEHLGDNSIFTGTRCSVISTVPVGLQNKVFLPGYYGAPPILKANLVKLQGKFFFSPTGIKEIGTTSSPWSCTIGEGVCSGETRIREAIAESIWVQLSEIA